MKNHTNLVFKATNSSLIAIILLISSFSFSYAQSDAKITIRFKVVVHDGDMKNTQITITKNGTPYKVITPDGSKRSIDLDLDATYTFSTTKMGYITKDIVYDTHIPSGRETEPFAIFQSIVELWPQPADAIITFSQPVGRIQYDEKSKDLDYDRDYTNTALEMQKQAMAHPVKKTKPPAPPPPPKVVSKPIPVEVKQPEIKHEPPPKPKVVEKVPVVPEKKIEKQFEQRVIQEDRKKQR